MDLDGALGECTLSLLRMIASAHRIPVAEDALRAELRSRLVARFAEDGYLSGYLSTLSPDETRVLQAVRASGWEAKGFVLNRISVGTKPTECVPGRPPMPISTLTGRGLLFRGFARIGRWRGEMYYVPDELVPAISGALPPLDVEPSPDLAPSIPVEPVPDSDLPWEAFCLLSLVQRSGLRLLHGELWATDLARLDREAGGAGPGEAARAQRWGFVLGLCLAGGWVRRKGAIVETAPRARLLLAGRRSDVQARLLDRYLANRAWSDLGRLGKVRQKVGSARIDESAARALLLHHLEGLPSDEWIEIAAFRDAIRSSDADFLREDYSSPKWGIVDAASGVELHGPDTWTAVEGEWIRYLLQGPLHWLGVVRLGADRSGRVLAFKRRAPAAQTEQGLASSSRGVLSLGVDGDLRVTATQVEDLAGLYELERYLDTEDVGAARRYRLTKASLLRAIDAGCSLKELRHLLARMGATVPEAADGLLAEWAGEYGRFDIDLGLLLNLADPRDADLLESLPGVAECIRARLGPSTYLVVPELKDRLVQALHAAGHTPRVHPRARSASSPPSPRCGGRGKGG